MGGPDPIVAPLLVNMGDGIVRIPSQIYLVQDFCIGTPTRSAACSLDDVMAILTPRSEAAPTNETEVIAVQSPDIRSLEFGLRSIVLDRNEILNLIEHPPEPGCFDIDDARRRHHVCSRTMTLIIQKGMIDVVRTLHHRTRQRTINITSGAIDEFFQRYETLGRLAHF